MSIKIRAAFMTATFGLSALITPTLVHSLPAFGASATTQATGPITPKAEDDPTFDCRRDGNRVCGSPRLRLLVKLLAQRPGLVKPGAWVSPPGPVLVAECFAAYPGDGKTGRAPRELIDCLTQPDPRLSDRSVITWHQNHVNHVNHTRRSR